HDEDEQAEDAPGSRREWTPATTDGRARLLPLHVDLPDHLELAVLELEDVVEARRRIPVLVEVEGARHAGEVDPLARAERLHRAGQLEEGVLLTWTPGDLPDLPPDRRGLGRVGGNRRQEADQRGVERVGIE